MAKKDAVTEEVQVEAVDAVEEIIDISDFEAATEAAVEGADETTGVPAEVLISAVRDAFQALPSIKAKNAAKASLKAQLNMFVKDMNMAGAKTVMTLSEEATVPAKAVSVKKEVNLSEVYTSKIAQLTLALYVVQNTIPEGLDSASILADAVELANADFPTALGVAQDSTLTAPAGMVSAALKLAAVKTRGGGDRATSGERRDLGAHIVSAFEGVEPGTWLSIADIRNHTSEIYGTDKPSAGAISNRLEPKGGKATSVDGITVERRDGKLGAFKN